MCELVQNCVCDLGDGLYLHDVDKMTLRKESFDEMWHYYRTFGSFCLSYPGRFTSWLALFSTGACHSYNINF